LGVHHRIGSLCTLDHCGEQHDPAAGLEHTLAERLDVLEAHDLGLLWMRDEEWEGLAYVTAGFLRCSRCENLFEWASIVERRLLLELEPGELAPDRLERDLKTVAQWKAAHERRCCKAIKGNRHEPDESTCPACKDMP
jgi:hypothetical protein